MATTLKLVERDQSSGLFVAGTFDTGPSYDIVMCSVSEGTEEKVMEYGGCGSHQVEVDIDLLKEIVKRFNAYEVKR